MINKTLEITNEDAVVVYNREYWRVYAKFGNGEVELWPYPAKNDPSQADINREHARRSAIRVSDQTLVKVVREP